MPRKLTANEIDNIMVGATFLGAGGGGPLDTGRELLKKQATGSYSIDLYSMDDIHEEDRDSTYGAMVACLGSPQKIKENGTFGPDGVACFDAFKKAMLLHDKKIKYLYSGEMGGMNTMVPMLVSIIAEQQGGASIGLLDFDANGRAVPELNTSLNAARGFAPNPVGLGALPTVEGKACTECIIECETDTESEAICRKLCEIYNSQVGFSTWAILSVKANGGDLMTELKKAFEVREFCHGTIEKLDIKAEGGFDFGTTVVKGEDGHKYFIDFKNENLILRDEKGATIMTAPDGIGMIDTDKLNGRIVSIRNVNIPVEELQDHEKLCKALVEQSLLAIREDGAHAIVMGCTGFVDVAERIKHDLLAEGYDVPVLEAAQSALKLCEVYAKMGLRQSRLTYMTPPERK